MKSRIPISVLLSVLALAGLIALFPPFQITWSHFFADPSPVSKKALYLFKVYGLPALMSFGAIVGFQLQARLGNMGASAGAVFPLTLFGSGFMMIAFRSMVNGVAGVPGYALGMALGYTMMSRVAAIQPSGKMLMGRPVFRIVWKSELIAQQMAAARLQERGEAPESSQRNAASNTLNSAKNNSLSLSHAEAGM